jgi:hypothetical protein
VSISSRARILSAVSLKTSLPISCFIRLTRKLCSVFWQQTDFLCLRTCKPPPYLLSAMSFCQSNSACVRGICLGSLWSFPERCFMESLIEFMAS